MKLWMTLILVGGVGLAMWFVSDVSYRRGQADYKADQAIQDRTAYRNILEEINNGTLDTSDNSAVVSELCRLAGYEPDDPECRSVRRD